MTMINKIKAITNFNGVEGVVNEILDDEMTCVFVEYAHTFAEPAQFHGENPHPAYDADTKITLVTRCDNGEVIEDYTDEEIDRWTETILDQVDSYLNDER